MTADTIQEDPSLLDAEAVARALGTDLESGLATEEAAARLASDGSNELRAAQREPTQVAPVLGLGARDP